jgi:glutamate/tyrosine decarboxylase-like PLP-dependent enzyme
MWGLTALIVKLIVSLDRGIVGDMSHTIDTIHPEEGLDPDDWDAMRRLGHRMVDDLVSTLERVRERPVWQGVPEESRAFLRQTMPLEPRRAEAVYDDVRTHVLPYPTGNLHPRFWGWVMGTGSPMAMFAEMLASGLNWNVGGFDDAASLVEDQVIGWCREIMGFPAGASGLLVSGGSMANLVGLAVARDARAGEDVRRRGVAAAADKAVLYASRETHSSVAKAAELLGLGTEALRLLPVDGQYRVDLAALRARIAADRTAGFRPFAVVGNAGTVNTGAVDDLDALADVCAGERLWFHVDGAFGALARLHPDLAPLVSGIERADSLAFDLHKWGYLPVEAGCVLVRDARAHRDAFAVKAAAYLRPAHGGPSARLDKFSDLGVQLSRSFRALKIWMSLQEHGVRKLGRIVRQNVEQARYLAGRIEATPELELAAPVPLNVVCYRHRGRPGATAEERDELNRELLVRLQGSGEAVPSGTVLDGRFAIRVAITNHRSRRPDFDLLVGASLRAADAVRDARAGRGA